MFWIWVGRYSLLDGTCAKFRIWRSWAMKGDRKNQYRCWLITTKQHNLWLIIDLIPWIGGRECLWCRTVCWGKNKKNSTVTVSYDWDKWISIHTHTHIYTYIYNIYIYIIYTCSTTYMDIVIDLFHWSVKFAHVEKTNSAVVFLASNRSGPWRS